jgi:hypothetical protein
VFICVFLCPDIKYFGCGAAALGLSVSLWRFLLGWPNPEFAPKGMAFQGPQEEYHEIKPPSSRRIPPFTFVLFFSAKKQACGPEARRCAEKASAQLFRIADFGFRIFWGFFFNPHSAICNPQFCGAGKDGFLPIQTAYFPARSP